MMVLFTLTGSIVLNVSLIIEQHQYSIERKARSAKLPEEDSIIVKPEVTTPEVSSIQ